MFKNYFLALSFFFIIGCCKEKQPIQKKNDHLSKASIYLGSGSLHLAEEEAKRAIEADPNNPEPYFILGKIYDEKNEDEKAINAYITAIRLSPKRLDEKIATLTRSSPFMQPMQKGSNKP